MHIFTKSYILQYIWSFLILAYLDLANLPHQYIYILCCVYSVGGEFDFVSFDLCIYTNISTHIHISFVSTKYLRVDRRVFHQADQTSFAEFMYLVFCVFFCQTHKAAHIWAMFRLGYLVENCSCSHLEKCFVFNSTKFGSAGLAYVSRCVGILTPLKR